MSGDELCIDTNNIINYNFLGLKEDIDKEYILKVFDTNYIPLNNIPISYYNTINPKVNDYNDELLNLLQKMNNNKNIYNTYNITPIFISILIFIFLFLILILRILFIIYNEFYSYLLIVFIAIIIIILSIWFLYINNQTL